jgi:Ser/Thr protein kinase RdoA (MazF antagonist)
MSITPFSPRYLVRIPRLDHMHTIWKAGRAIDHEGIAGARDVLREYGLNEAPAMRLAGSGGRGVSFIAAYSSGSLIIKRYKRTVDRDTISHEHSILEWLNDHHFPATRLIYGPGGRSFVEKDGVCYALFNFEPGYLHYHEHVFWPVARRDFVAASGRALGALHTTLRGCQPRGFSPNGFVTQEGGRHRDLNWYRERVERCSRANVQLSAGLKYAGWPLRDDVLNQVWDRLSSLAGVLERTEPTRGVIHGDYGPYNILFRRGKPVFIVDFELARLDWLLTDLASALRTFASHRRGFDWDEATLFVSAYRSVAPIDLWELRLLPTVWQFLALRRFVVCLDRFRTTAEDTWLAEADRRLRLADWANENGPRFASLCRAVESTQGATTRA